MNCLVWTIEVGENEVVALLQYLTEVCSTDQDLDIVLLDNDAPEERC